MGIRITTWNVNGIRNPFGYQPWSENRTFQAMFDTLEADIVVMQETKIQGKDLQDDMVLVPGWDVFFSLPKHKKGYSGVAIYTRTSKCCPIRAEEGITGILCPPNSSTRFRDLPPDQQIGGYLKPGQLSSSIDEATLDSEGRCVILEFPAFVLLGVYSPATRNETRTEFRRGFLDVLDARVRNLVALGKQVILTGDLNIMRNEMDTAGVHEMLRKEDMTMDEFMAMHSRRFLNQLLFGGRVVGDRDEGREQPVLWDLCREFHPSRPGMFTCWDTKKNCRPGNYGSRIDYVLCSSGIKDWFMDSNIQEGLLGSDHCPVYATLHDTVEIEGQTLHVIDKLNPEGMFLHGKRLQDWTTKNLLSMSAKLIPEFDRRRSIRDMFKPRKEKEVPNPGKEMSGQQNLENKEVRIATNGTAHQDKGVGSSSYPSLTETAVSALSLLPPSPVLSSTPTLPAPSPVSSTPALVSSSSLHSSKPPLAVQSSLPSLPPVPPPDDVGNQPAKRQAASPASTRPQKKNKATLKKESPKTGPGKGQSSLMGFFKPKTSAAASTSDLSKETDGAAEANPTAEDVVPSPSEQSRGDLFNVASTTEPPWDDIEEWESDTQLASKEVFDPIKSKESWSKLLGKRVPPKCEHEEHCISLLTKKPGVNCGRSFYICPRPLGPSGDKEQGTPFRCKTFIWSSDWNGRQ